jgi:hypothetical protein
VKYFGFAFQTTCWEEGLLGPRFPYMSKVTVLCMAHI